MKKIALLFVLTLLFSIPFLNTARADASGPVISAFQQNSAANVKEPEGDVWKHKILFIMGAILIVLVILTASLGIGMAMYGKQVFVAHMVSAGATVFLALAHAVASIVWFFPYK